MKKLLTMICVVALSTGYAATDAELKAMLEAKDYKGFALQATSVQVTNLLTAADARAVAEVCAGTNKIWKTIYICRANLLDWQTASDIAIEKKNPGAILVAYYSKNDDLFVDAWSKVVDMPETDITELYRYTRYAHELKNQNLELTKKTAERIRTSNSSKFYTRFIYMYLTDSKYNWSDEYKAWANDCIKNVNEKTCDVDGWYSLYFYNPDLIKTDAFYFENIWKNEKAPAQWILSRLRTTSYYSKAVEVIASSVTDPKSAFEFAKYVDRCAENQDMTKRLYPVISKDIHCACEAAFYLDDADKVIDIVLNAGEELTLDELNKIIPIINALDVDHRSAEVVKALRNINSRYTLKLADDKENYAAWQTVLSKIRAMIDVRQ